LKDQPPLADVLDGLLRFGALMLRAGNPSFRVREATSLLARHFAVDSLALEVSLNGMTATVRRGKEHATLAVDVAPLGINVWRMGALSRMVEEASSDPKTAGLTLAALAARLDAIEAASPLHLPVVVAVAVGLASASFAYLNGGSVPALIAAFIAGGLGQMLRGLLLGRRLNQYAVTALCAVVAAGLFCLVATLQDRTGIGRNSAAGFISSVLFLVPGFPLVAALLDLLQHQMVAGIARLAYGMLVLLAAAFGLSIVAAMAGLTVTAPLPPTEGMAAILALRGLASFVGGCGFSILYNSSWRTVLTVGALAVVGNELRLGLHDLGLGLPPATFIGALMVGLLSSVVESSLREPRIAFTVPGIIIMVPGLYAFQTVVQFAQGNALAGLEAAVLTGFVVGAMALGLVAARFITERRWLVES
jgi:uncharacterized membrane protein YjjP (DUF1212 family)